MDIKSKVTAVAAGVAAASLGLAVLLLKLSVAPQFTELEHQEAQARAERTVNIINNRLDDLYLLVEDWSVWTDTLDYVRDPAPDAPYVLANLAPISLEGLKLNFLGIFDRTGQAVWAHGSDEDYESLTDIPGLSDGRLPADHPLNAAKKAVGTGTRGLWLAPMGPSLVGAGPISDSEGVHLSEGTLIMARPLDAAFLESLGGLIGAELLLYKPGDRWPEAAAGLVDGSNKATVVFHPEADKKERVYTLLPDVFGDPIFLLEAQMTRVIEPAGEHVIASALVSAAIGSIAILIVLWLGLQRLVANPIIRLRDHVLLVGETGDLYRESGLAGRSDEVGELAGAFESMQSRVAKMAHYDGLTGLPNRTLFRDRAEQAMRRARRNGTKAAFLFVDLDRFKSINDTYGHDYGDRFLAAVASRLIRQLKEGDTVARFGGDEFVFVMDGIPGQDAVVDICDRLRAAFIEPVNIDDDRLFANMSIGVSIYPDDGETVTDLTRKADSAMYQAKEDGRNTYRFFNPEIEEKVQERLRADSSLRMAVEAGDLLLHYQPIMDLESDRIIAVEALARWPDAEKGLVRAEVFLTRVQDGEALGRLDAWAVAESAKAARALQDRGLHDVPVAVNVGAASFNSGALTALVENAARDAGVDAGRLRIEVTEHALLLDQEHTHGILRRLKKMGCRIILDDFGTGFSALGYLRQFELDGLKVDKRFIRGADRDENHGAIVEAVLALGRALKLDVIAEGVETPGEQDFLIAKGCHFAQGYHFSDALALDDLIALLETRRQAGKA